MGKIGWHNEQGRDWDYGTYVPPNDGLGPIGFRRLF